MNKNLFNKSRRDLSGIKMEVKIKKTTIGHIIDVELKEGEKIYAEPGALISYTGEVDLKSGVGDLIGGALRALGGGESLFINEITAKTKKAHLEIGTSFPSEIVEIDLNGSMILGDGVYIAHTGEIEISAKFGGLSAFASGSGLMFLHAKGNGKLYIGAFESMFKKELKEGESFYVDNSCFVACDDGMQIEKKMMGKGLLSKVVGGEGIFFKITGPGTVYYSTESARDLAASLAKYLTRS